MTLFYQRFVSFTASLLAVCILIDGENLLSADVPAVQRRGPFLVTHETSLEACNEAIRHLEKIAHEIEALLGIRPRSDQLIQITLFSRDKNLQRFLAQEHPLFKGREAVYVRSPTGPRIFAASGPSLVENLRHESVHAILHQHFPVVPLWLDEGLAEYFEAPFEESMRKDPHLDLVTKRAKRGDLPALAVLETRNASETLSIQDYEASWAWIHFCLVGSTVRRNSFLTYLNDLKYGDPSSTSLSLALGKECSSKKLCDHILTISKQMVTP